MSHQLICSIVMMVLPTWVLHAETPASRPNIIIIMADDMGFSDIGCYGSEIATPNLDRLAAGGLRFTQFYNTARCCPTRASLLTGLYSHQAGVGHMVANYGVPGYQGFLNRRCVTIAELLRPAGYRTYLSGKWHVGENRPHWPVDRGFERSYALVSGGTNYFRLDSGRKLARDDQLIKPDKKWYVTDALTDNAVQLLQDHGRSEKPFFLYLAYTAPHWPLHARPEDIAKYRGKYKDGWDALRQSRHRRMIELGIVDARWPLTPRDNKVPAWKDVAEKERDEWDLRMAVYAAQIDRMDQGIGKVMAKVRELGAEHNTLVLFLSDNGGCAEVIDRSQPGARAGTPDSFLSYGPGWANASNTPFRLYKHWVHEGGIATPLIAHWPATVRSGGSLTQQPGHVIDLMATCLDVAGVSYPKTYHQREVLPLEGKSLLPVFKGETRPGHEAIFWEHEGNRAVRQGNWKLVARHKGAWELYDLAADRTELHNLANQHPEKVKELATKYKEWSRRCGVEPWSELAPRQRANPPTEPPRPNILWLVAEDLGPHLGCYGTKEVWTPNLDRLAAEGVRYSRAFTTAPVCSPSRSAFMTGMYQTTIGAHQHRSHRDDGFRSPEGVRVASDWMREAKYFTANVEKFPNSVGFNGTGKTDWNFTYVGKPFDSDRWTDLKPHQPFFAQVNFKETHRTFSSPKRADPAKVEIPPYYPDHPVTRTDWAKYLDAVTELDDKVGKILKQLEADGLADNTVVFFTADNGQAHVRGKQWCYDSGLHVPLIIRWPKNFPAPKHFTQGTTDDRLIAAIDLLPTMLDIAGMRKPVKMQGEIFLGPNAAPPRQYVFGARDRCDETVARFRTVRDARHRYIRNFMPDRPFLQANQYKERSYPVWNLIKDLHAQGKLTPTQAVLAAPNMPPEELYDLTQDPHEITNLVNSADPEHQAAVKRLRNVLEQWMTDSNDQGRIPEPAEVAKAKGVTKPGSKPNAEAIVGEKEKR